MREDSRFDFFLDRVRKLHPFVGEKFDAIVLIRIVRSGDDDAYMEIVLADEAGNARSGKNAGEGNGGATLDEAGGHDGRYVRTGFASVGTDEGVGRSVVAVKKFGNGKT